MLRVPDAAAVGVGTPAERTLRQAIFGVGLLWTLFQFWIVAHPQQPLIERPIHLVFALILIFLVISKRRMLDISLAGAAAVLGVYFVTQSERLSARIEAIDPILPLDIAAGAVLLVLLLEGVRRSVGWSLLG